LQLQRDRGVTFDFALTKRPGRGSFLTNGR
jgi:hypothetical protein